MKAFVSWSGTRGRDSAVALREFLPLLLQRLNIFSTTDDIEKGSRWLTEVSSSIKSADLALVCVTPESVNSPWLVYEVGALAATLGPTRIVPILIGMSPVDLTGPLVQFQSCRTERSDFWRLVQLINSLDEPRVPDEMLEKLYEMLWPRLEGTLSAIAAEQTVDAKKAPSARTSDRELMDQMLKRLEAIQQRLANVENNTGRGTPDIPKGEA